MGDLHACRQVRLGHARQPRTVTHEYRGAGQIGWSDTAQIWLNDCDARPDAKGREKRMRASL
jgi:hypothetical protein